MQRGQRAVRERLEEREMKQIDVEMEHIELVGARADLVQHREMRGNVGLERVRIEPHCLLAHRDEARPRAGVAAREERHIVAELHERIRQVGYDPFGAAIETGGTASANGATNAIFNGMESFGAWVSIEEGRSDVRSYRAGPGIDVGGVPFGCREWADKEKPTAVNRHAGAAVVVVILVLPTIQTPLMCRRRRKPESTQHGRNRVRFLSELLSRKDLPWIDP